MHTHTHTLALLCSGLLSALVSSPSEDKKSKKKKKKSKKSKKVKPEDEVDEDEVVPKKKSTFLCTFAPRSNTLFAAKHASSCTKTAHHPYHTECYCPRNCKEYNECMTDNHDLVLVSFALLPVQCSAVQANAHTPYATSANPTRTTAQPCLWVPPQALCCLGWMILVLLMVFTVF